jgi:uncharacterized cupredoxin-like copper-binding protein
MWNRTSREGVTVLKKYSSIFALGVAVLLVSAACASTTVQEGAIQPTGDTTPTTVAGAGATGDNVVEVTLSEFAVELSQTDFEAGVEYTFTVTNTGVVPHEMMLIAPVDGSGEMSMEDLDEMAVAVFSAEELTAGATVVQTVTFDEATSDLEAACYVPGHYEAGMNTAIAVTG